MNNGFLSSVGPILAAPWHQRRNAGSMWGAAVVVFMLALAPALLFGWSLFVLWGAPSGPAGSAPAAEIAAEIRHTAANAGLWALGASSLAAWAVAVSNLLAQNRPVLARLVPDHPARLRVALLVAWVATVAFLTLIIGVRCDEPLACATVAAVGTTLLAASIRWPILWLLGCVSPVGVNLALAWPGLPHAIDVVRSHWRGQPAAIFLTLAAASAVLLVALIQSGGARHVASDEARRQRVQRFLMRARGSQPVAVGTRGMLDTLLTRPYYAWWRHVLSRPASSVFSRVMLGLSPGAHWMASASAVVGSALAMFAGLAVLEFVGLFYAPAAHVAPDVLASLTVGVTIGLLSPALQIQARLFQSRREQALLALLPGVPRGAVLNRRLAWQLTGQFLLAWAGAQVVIALSLATAHALRPDVVRPVLLDLCAMFAVAAPPLVVFQWRAWARAGAPTALSSIGPLTLGALIVAAAWAGPFTGWLSLPGVAAWTTGAAIAWCAMRWSRMGREPSALPFGRLG